MLAASGIGSTAALAASDLDALIGALGADGRCVIGPTIRDGAIVYDAVCSASDLPVGWTSRPEAGRYRLEERADRAYFGYTVGPTTWRRYLDPPRRTLFRARRTAGGAIELTAEDGPVPPLAFLGVRPCDLASIAIHDRVFLHGPFPDLSYRARRDDALIVAIHCTEAADTCFCASFGAGPEARGGYDLALTELVDAPEHLFVVTIGTERGAAVARSLPLREATAAERHRAEELVTRTRDAIGRSIDTDGLRERIGAAVESPRWSALERRCLGCAGCTLVCPTCFCSTVEDRSGLDVSLTLRERRWDSCFTLGISHVHGGSHRTSIASRYRQWLTHKLATYHDQFGTAGCVGCGRCIAWCPAGIDIRREAAALTAAEA